MKFDPVFAAGDMLKVLDFDKLPRMISPLTLDDLKEFYQQQAAALGYTATEEGEAP
jgi:hypothetical protein